MEDEDGIYINTISQLIKGKKHFQEVFLKKENVTVRVRGLTGYEDTIVNSAMYDAVKDNHAKRLMFDSATNPPQIDFDSLEKMEEEEKRKIIEEIIASSDDGIYKLIDDGEITLGDFGAVLAEKKILSVFHGIKDWITDLSVDDVRNAFSTDSLNKLYLNVVKQTSVTDIVDEAVENFR